jgi:hypothetical protein
MDLQSFSKVHSILMVVKERNFNMEMSILQTKSPTKSTTFIFNDACHTLTGMIFLFIEYYKVKIVLKKRIHHKIILKDK